MAYHVAFANEYLQQILKARLGIAFSPRWVDLAWLLPAMFSDISHKPLPLDEWLLAFGLDVGTGRRSVMENTLLLGRLLQMLRWLFIALLSYEWLSFVLSRFPYTRAWGERLNDYLLDVLERLASGIISAVPGLGVAITAA